jgi:glycerol-3-phosphate dehydrogenase
MKRTESTSSAQALKKTHSEEFDLVILGGGTGSGHGVSLLAQHY